MIADNDDGAAYLVLNRCPHGIESISFDYASSGYRVVGKCCRQWTVVKRWLLTMEACEEIEQQIGEIMEMYEKQEEEASEDP